MKTFVIIVIVLAIVYFLIRDFWPKINWSRKKTIEPEEIEGERTIDEILEGISFGEIYEELNAKELENLTLNECHVLFNITKYVEDNQR